ARRGPALAASLLVLPVALWSYLFLISYFTGLYQTPEKYLAPRAGWGDAPPQESPISAACFLMMAVAIYFVASNKARKARIALLPKAPGVVEPFFPGGFAAASAAVVALASLIGALG